MFAQALRHSIRRSLPFGNHAGSEALPSSARTKLVPVSIRIQHRTMVVVTKTSVDDISVAEGNSDSGSTSSSASGLALENDASSGLLTITPNCVQQIHTLLKKKQVSPDEMHLRVYVDAGGCSGFSYKFELDDQLEDDDDIVFVPPEGEGVRVVVDSASLELIQGSTVDYVQEMIKSAFVVVDNPQSESACGCGSSFAVKNFSANPALD